MPVGSSDNTTFARVATMPGGGEDAAAKLKKLLKQLSDSGADGAAARFGAIGDKVADKSLNFEDLEQYLDPDRAVDELNSARGRLRVRKLVKRQWRAGLRPLLGFPKSVRYAHLFRNVAALVPLIFTWIMLGLAAQHYGSELKANPGVANEPFLLLWQQGFGHRFLSFELVTIIDFSLLALVVLLTVWVHWAEGQADRSADSVYQAVDSLKAVLTHRHLIPTNLTPEEWARTASDVLSKTLDETRELNEASKRAVQASEDAIKDASQQLTSIQDTGERFLEDVQNKTKEFIGEFKTAVLQTLTSVTEQNEHFIEHTLETNQRVLQALVEQQMRPLLGEVQSMLDQFRTQQATYTVAVTGLTKSAGAIETSAAVLATSAQSFGGSTQAIAGSLTGMATSQERFTSRVDGAAQSMVTAAAEMTEVKNALRADLHERLHEMTGNITGASASLREAQEGLLQTTEAMKATARALAGTAEAWSGMLTEPIDRLQRAVSQADPVEQPQRRRLLRFGRGS